MNARIQWINVELSWENTLEACGKGLRQTGKVLPDAFESISNVL